MTPSTTNTAARELLASALDECGRPTDAAEVREGRNPFVRGEYALAAIEKALTQQQGGEQEVAWQSIETAEAEFLTNLADKGGLADPVPGMLRHCARLIAGKRPAVVAPDRYETEEEGDAYAHGYVDGEDAARSKQPAASEGDGKPLVPPCDACGGRGCIDHGDTEIGSALFDCEECDGSGLANTSKQAAGEAVLAHEPMVPRKDMQRLYNAYVRLLESGRDRIRDLGGECDGVDVMERNDLDLRHARDVLTTPPRHPADEGAVDDSMVERAADAYEAAAESEGFGLE